MQLDLGARAGIGFPGYSGRKLSFFLSFSPLPFVPSHAPPEAGALDFISLTIYIALELSWAPGLPRFPLSFRRVLELGALEFIPL
jgi:hypothetical protein